MTVKTSAKIGAERKIMFRQSRLGGTNIETRNKFEYQMSKCPPWCDPLKRAIAYVSTQTLLMLKKELVYGLGQGPKRTHWDSMFFIMFFSLEHFHFCHCFGHFIRSGDIRISGF